MSHVLHRDARTTPPIAVGGEGIHVIDSEGRRYIDASGGAAVSCLGHDDAEVRAAIHAQVDSLAYAHSSFFTTAVAEELADRLIADAPAGLDRVYYVSGGSEGTEAAIKMARQYFVEIGQPQRRHIVSRWQSYHGNTLGALMASGNAWRREPYAPLLVDTPHIAPCFEYRHRRPDETSEEYGRRAADELEVTVQRLGPDTVFAFIAETVVGATGGVVPAAPGYFTRIREICDRYGILLILDEVMCGMGRTGTLHACEQEGVSPDLLVIAKGLGAGYQPIGAVLLAGRIFEAFQKGSGSFSHTHTYMGHATACAAALAVQNAIRNRGLLEQVRARGDYLAEALTERLGNHPHVGDIRGRGLFRGIELVEERADKRPFDPGLKLHSRIKAEAMARGLMCYPAGGTVDGKHGDHILLAPPFIVEEADIDTIVERLGESIDAACAAAKTQSAA
ncbi:MAG: aspartate aminotransferase family protein [Acetobacterales bacterium]